MSNQQMETVRQHGWKNHNGRTAFKECIHCKCIRMDKQYPGDDYAYRLRGGVFSYEEPPCITRKKPEDDTGHTIIDNYNPEKDGK